MLKLDERKDASRYRELRAEPRASVSLIAILSRPGGTDVRVTVRNLSSGGMMAECTIDFAKGEAIGVALTGLGLVGGKIAWTAHGRIGVAFDRAIDPALAR